MLLPLKSLFYLHQGLFFGDRQKTAELLPLLLTPTLALPANNHYCDHRRQQPLSTIEDPQLHLTVVVLTTDNGQTVSHSVREQTFDFKIDSA